jgi:hypothetical protein
VIGRQTKPAKLGGAGLIVEFSIDDILARKMFRV